MSLNYTHLLIPRSPTFTPAPDQIAHFFENAEKLGAAPLEAVLSATAFIGEFRTSINPATGRAISVPRYNKRLQIRTVADMQGGLQAIEDFNIRMSGTGPPALPAFKFNFQGSYEFGLCCYRRPRSALMSTDHYQEPSDSPPASGKFLNPVSGDNIEVPDAGSAKFWVALEFGKFLVPAIGSSFEIINPVILRSAEDAFGVRFAQGGHYD